MLIIIPTTHRDNSMTYKVAKIYKRLMEKNNIKTEIFSLLELPKEFMQHHFEDLPDERFKAIMEARIVPENKFLLIMPEYNGSIPGVFKVMIDACDIERCFKGKKVALVGVAAGRAGNLRGMDHLTDIFHHIGAEVLSNKIPMSSIRKELNEEGNFINPAIEKVIEKQILQFENF
jgi:chromate reductase